MLFKLTIPELTGDFSLTEARGLVSIGRVMIVLSTEGDVQP